MISKTFTADNPDGIRTSDNIDITQHDSNLNDNNGYYIVVDDASSGLPRNSNTEVEFQGFVNDTLVIQKRLLSCLSHFGRGRSLYLTTCTSKYMINIFFV